MISVDYELRFCPSRTYGNCRCSEYVVNVILALTVVAVQLVRLSRFDEHLHTWRRFLPDLEKRIRLSVRSSYTQTEKKIVSIKNYCWNYEKRLTSKI